MRIPMKPLFALILAVILPMRGFASATHCEAQEQGARTAPPVESALHDHGHYGHTPTPADAANGGLFLQAAEATHCRGGKGAAHAHGCGDCCGGGAALAAPRFTLPKAAAARIVRPPAWPPPALAIDRLDRPPRLPG
jgi:hypothetical protein